MRIGGQSAAHSQGKTNFLLAAVAYRGGQAHIVNFWIGAPVAAARDGNFEFARQIIELRVAAKLRDLGLSAAQVREMVARQIYVERYIDYKFRPTVQIESADIENYYQRELLPELAEKNKPNSGGLPVEPAPTPRLAEVEGQIRELLTQRAITNLATKWLDETKSRLKIEVTAPVAKP